MRREETKISVQDKCIQTLEYRTESKEYFKELKLCKVK